MAGDKKKKNTVYQKKADSEFRKGTNNVVVKHFCNTYG